MATAVGEYAVCLNDFALHNGFAALPSIQPYLSVFSKPALNNFAILGQALHSEVRKYLQDVFMDPSPIPHILQDNEELRRKCLVPLEKIDCHLPFKIGEYTDFFVGLYHAEKAADVFGVDISRNYKHMPLGYTGRASSVVVSGTPVPRPKGQILQDPDGAPILSPCQKLDFEIELACFICKPSTQGKQIHISEAHAYIFGMVMMNDWSARDIQSWEMAPLGPLTSKSFATTVSPWVVLTEALEPFLVPAITNDQILLPYLIESTQTNVYDINLEVELQTQSAASRVISRTNGRHLLFSFPQILTHLTVSGCPVNVGDLVASGTVSGPDRASYASLLELTDNGALAIFLESGDERRYLHDGDTVIFTGVCGENEEGLVGFGTCIGTIMPAL